MNPGANGRWIERRECKYLVTEAVAASIRASVEPFVTPDPHAAGRPSHTYPIVSLYLDSSGLQLNRETLEGQRDRFKLRIRSYTDDPADSVFLEVKRRRNQIVHKDRCALSRLDATRLLLQRGAAETPRVCEAERKLGYSEFMRLMLQIDARPKVLIRYERQAYVGTFDPEARVTFDRRLAAAMTTRPEVRMEGGDFTVVEDRLVILELKFNRLCPAWLDAVVRSHGLRQRSFSKYSVSLASPMLRGCGSIV